MNECVICFDSMDKKQKLVKCFLCFNYVHTKCYDKWIKKNEITSSIYYQKCFYCQQRGGLNKINISCLDKFKGCFR